MKNVTNIPLYVDNRNEIITLNLVLPIHVCNYRCEYCYLKKTNEINMGFIEQQKELLKNLQKVNRPMIIIFGVTGEILAVPELWSSLALLSEIKNIKWISLITNLSKDFDWIERYYPLKKISIIATYHPSSFKDFSIESKQFFKRVEHLKKNALNVIVNYVATPDQIQEYENVKNILDNLGVCLTVNPLIGTFRGKFYPRDYTDAERNKVNEIMENDIISTYFLHGKRPQTYCTAGRDLLVASPDGTAYRCEHIKEKRGNFMDEEGPLIDIQSEICEIGGCSCKYTIGYSETVVRDYKRINSLFNFVKREKPGSGVRSFELTDCENL